MKCITKGVLLAAMTVLVLPLAIWAADRPIVERKSPDREPMTDQEFLARAIDINAGEVKLADRVLKESENKNVRAFAQMMKDDHTKMGTDLLQVAKSMRVAVVEGLGKDFRDELTRLGKLRGADFDREYINNQVEDHEKALKLFNTWAKKATNSDLRDVASKGATKTEEHLRKAKEIQGKLKSR
jgi:putative membrane protein